MMLLMWLERLFFAKMEIVQVLPRRKELPLESPRNHTIGYQAFMKITMDLGGTDPDTIDSYLASFSSSS